MTDREKKLEEWRQWCQEAKTILGSGFNGTAKRMNQSIQQIHTDLTHLSQQNEKSDKAWYEETARRFEEISNKAKSYVEEYRQADASIKLAKEKLKQAKRTLEDYQEKVKRNPGLSQSVENAKLLVETLQANLQQAENEKPKIEGKVETKIKELNEEIATLNTDLKQHQPISRALHYFEKAARVQKDRLQSASKAPNANVENINFLLQVIEVIEQKVETSNDPQFIEQQAASIKEQVDKYIRGEETTITQLNKQDLKQAGAKPGAERRMEETKQLLKDLEVSGKLSPRIKTLLESKIREAEQKISDQDWVSAASLLGDVPTLEACEKDFSDSETVSVRTYAEPIKALDKALAALTELVDKDTYEEFKSRRNLLVADAAQYNYPPENEKNAIVQKFEILTTELTGLESTAISQRNAVNLKWGVLSQDVKKRLTVSPLHVTQENASLLSTFESYKAERLWIDALNIASTLEKYLRSQDLTAFENWLTVEPELTDKKVQEELNAALSKPGMTPDLLSQARVLLDSSGPKAIEGRLIARDWDGLVSLHQEVTNFLNSLDQVVHEVSSFDPERKLQNEKMSLSFGLCDDQLKGLSQTLVNAQVVDQESLLSPLTQRLAAIKSEWNEKLVNASSVDELALVNTHVQIDSWLEGVRLLGESDFSAVRDDQLREKGQAEFTRAAEVIRSGVLAKLMPISAKAAVAHQKKILIIEQDAGIEGDSTQPWAARLQLLKELGETIAGDVEKENKRCGEFNDKVKNAAEEIRNLLRQAEIALLKEGGVKLKLGGDIGGILESPFAPMMERLTTEFDNIQNLTNTRSASAAETNLELLEALRRRLETLISLASNTSAIEDQVKNISGLESRLRELKNMGKDVEQDWNDLSSELTDLKQTVFAQDSVAAANSIKALGNSIDAALKKGQDVQEVRIKASGDAHALKLRVKNLGIDGSAGELVKSLKERIQAAKAKSESAVQLPLAVSELRVLEREIEDIEKNPNKAGEMQQKVLKEQLDNQLLQKEYNSELKDVETKDMERAKAAVGKDDPAGLLDEFKRIIGAAKDCAKEKNFERALQTLQKARQRVREIEKNPQGTGLGSRNALPKHAASFGAEISKLRKALDEFVQQAEAIVPTEMIEPLKSKLVPTISSLKTRLNPRIFDAAVGQVTSETATQAQRRAAQADALARLRQLRTAITQQPRLVALAGNPVRSIRPEMALIDISLNRLEAHLRSSVRS